MADDIKELDADATVLQQEIESAESLSPANRALLDRFADWLADEDIDESLQALYGWYDLLPDIDFDLAAATPDQVTELLESGSDIHAGEHEAAVVYLYRDFLDRPEIVEQVSSDRS